MKNRKYTDSRPEISDAEIDGFKDFEGVMDKVNSLPPDNPLEEEGPKLDLTKILKYSKNGLLVAAAATIAFFSYTFLNEKVQTDIETKDKVEVADEAEKRAIDPPIPGLETPYTTYTIDAQKDHEIVTEVGTKIKIEANSFKDAEGNMIQGDVDILFREYHDVVSIFTSGIPMEYDSAGKSYTFESAGMFDIQVEQNGVPITNFEKDLKVEIPSENSSTAFNDYYYDTTARGWQYIAPSTIVENNEEPELDGDLYGSDADVEAIITELQPKNQVVTQPPAIKEPTQPKQIDYPPLLSDKYAFNVDYNRKKFPELVGNILFQVDETKSTFSPVYYKVKWDKLELARADERGLYTLHLEKGEEKLEVVCFPVITEEERSKLQAEYDNALKAYQDSLAIWNAYIASITPQVPGLGDGNHFLAKEEASLLTGLTYRNVTVPRSGVYNCDQPLFTRKYFGDEVKAKFRSENGSVKPMRTYTAEPGRNALFGARNKNILMLSRTRKLVGWVWTQDHKLAVISAEDLKDYKEIKVFDVKEYSPEEGLGVIKSLLKG